MIIRVINQLRDDSFPEKIISKGQAATVGHFVDKAPEAQSIPLLLDRSAVCWDYGYLWGCCTSGAKRFIISLVERRKCHHLLVSPK